MSLAEASELIAVICFAIYGVASALEAGVAMNLLIDSKKTSQRFFTPLWEVTNVFMIFGVTAIAMLFNNALQSLSQALLSTLLVGLAALIVRSAVVLVIFYWRAESSALWLTRVFALSCFTIPLSFAAAGAYFFTGHLFWQTFTGWVLMFTALLGILSIGLLTMNRNRRSAWLPNELVFVVWLILLGTVLPLSAKLSMPHLHKIPIIILNLLGIVGLTLAWLGFNRPKIKLWRWAVGIALVSPLLLTWANHPYLVANRILLDKAFSAAAYGSVFIIGSLVILPLVLLGFFLFWKLLKSSK